MPFFSVWRQDSKMEWRVVLSSQYQDSPCQSSFSWHCAHSAWQSLAKANNRFLDDMGVLSKTDLAWLSFHCLSFLVVIVQKCWTKPQASLLLQLKLDGWRKFSEQLQVCYKGRNITNNIIDPTAGEKNHQSLVRTYNSKARQKTLISF